MKLPMPNEFGTYILRDGSRIYPSGGTVIPVKPGKFFVWLKTGELFEGTKRQKVSVGKVLTGAGGILYFDDPDRALRLIEDLAEGLSAKAIAPAARDA